MNTASATQSMFPLYPPTWADKFGEDDFGIFACFFVGKVEFDFRWIPPGRFEMGSPKTEVGRFPDEGPQVEREVAGFWLGATPVTQEQWLSLLNYNPSYSIKGALFPVEQVDWMDAWVFANELGQKTGAPLRLPGEREWEYACRAGIPSALYTGKELTTKDGRCPNLDEIAWYSENSGGGSHKVGGKMPNAWGLYDMLGNVWEWCADPWDADAYGKVQRGETPRLGADGARRVVRGGSWGNPARNCRAAYRNRVEPDDRRYYLGFRLAAGQEPRAAEPTGSGATLP